MSKNQTVQINDEKWYFEYFRKCYDKPLNDPDPDHSGKPDFLIEMDDKVVGIELTEYSNPSVMENMSLRQRAMDLAEIKCNDLIAGNHHNYSGHVIIDYKHDIFLGEKRKIKTEIIANRIATLVYKEIDAIQDQKDQYKMWKLMRKYDLEDFVYEVSFQPYTNFHKLLWNCTYNAFRAANLGNQGTIDGILKAIQKKQEKHNKYLKACDECWLLIHHVVSSSLVDFDGHNEEIEAIYRQRLKNSPFTKIAFMTTGGKHQLVWFKG